MCTLRCSLSLSLSLSPQFYEPLKLFYGEGRSLELKVSGVGIKTEVSLSPELEEGEDGESVLNLGHVMANDTVERTLQLHNKSPLEVRFETVLESTLPESQRKERENTFSKSIYL